MQTGERLLQMVSPCFQEIEAGVTAITELLEKPADATELTRSKSIS
jgi:hypothetical protein